MSSGITSDIRPLDERDVFIRGKVVILKALTRDDVQSSNWYGWFNDEEVCVSLQKHYYPNTLDAQLAFWEGNIAGAAGVRGDKLQLGICRVGCSALLGVVSLNSIDCINRKCEFSMVVGEREGRNIAVFLDAARLIFRHAFNTLNMNKVYGGTISKELLNLMCRSLGCQEEGVGRQEVFKHGRYLDVYRYGLLREECSFT